MCNNLMKLYMEKEQLRDALQDIYLQMDTEQDLQLMRGLDKQAEKLRKDLQKIVNQIRKLELSGAHA